MTPKPKTSWEKRLRELKEEYSCPYQWVKTHGIMAVVNDFQPNKGIWIQMTKDLTK